MVKWIKINIDIFDNEKIKLLLSENEGYQYFTAWIRLLTLAGKTNDEGQIYITKDTGYEFNELCRLLEMDPGIVEEAMDMFSKYGMISQDENNIVHILNWEKHQNSAALSRIRTQTKLRVRRYRERKAASNDSNANVTQENKKKNKNLREKEIQSVFDFWNEQKIVVHGKLDLVLAGKIKKAIDVYELDGVTKAIENYAMTIQSDRTYWTKKWTLAEFMSRGIDRFKDLDDPVSFFLKYDSKPAAKNIPGNSRSAENILGGIHERP